MRVPFSNSFKYISPLNVLIWGVVMFILLIMGKCALSSESEVSFSNEVITYSIPVDKQTEAAKLYKEVYDAAVKSDRASWARNDAQEAVDKIYGVKEVSRKVVPPEKSRK